MSAETYYKATNQISLSFHRSWHTIILSLLSEFFSSNLAKGCSCKWPFGAPFTVWHAMQMQRGFSPWSWSSSLPTLGLKISSEIIVNNSLLAHIQVLWQINLDVHEVSFSILLLCPFWHFRYMKKSFQIKDWRYFTKPYFKIHFHIQIITEKLLTPNNGRIDTYGYLYVILQPSLMLMLSRFMRWKFHYWSIHR